MESNLSPNVLELRIFGFISERIKESECVNVMSFVADTGQQCKWIYCRLLSINANACALKREYNP